ncbi:unnamed protein product [Soboliphyme baturini]|uniref:BPI2 domain-containing protein n=1 Tax=Soboliphyme baturini TaxID=241478 RepID=A0A183IV05_9BILA|nr:unnamed protein product [Soboliphyme baturini]
MLIRFGQKVENEFREELFLTVRADNHVTRLKNETRALRLKLRFELLPESPGTRRDIYIFSGKCESGDPRRWSWRRSSSTERDSEGRKQQEPKNLAKGRFCISRLQGMISSEASDSPSFVVRITQQGLDGLKKSIEPVVSNTFQRFRVDDVYDASVLGQGLTISNLRVQSFTQAKPIDIRLVRSDAAQVVIDAPDVDLSVAVDARVGLLLYQYTTFFMQLRKFRLTVGVHLKPGRPPQLLSAAVSTCQVTIEAMDVDVGQLKLQNMLFVAALPFLKPIIKKLTRETFCSTLMRSTAKPSKYIGTYDPMLHVRRTSGDYQQLVERLTAIINGIEFKFALMHKPTVVGVDQYAYLETLVSVDITSEAHPPPPFAVDPLASSSSSSSTLSIPCNYNKMINVAVNQYVVNTLFYYVHENGGLKLKVSVNESKSLRDLLRLRCDDDLSCIGLLLPDSVTAGHEANDGELLLNFMRPPRISVDKTGIRVHLDDAAIDYRFQGQNNSLLSFTISAKGTLNLQMYDRTMVGKLTITDVHLSPRNDMDIGDFGADLIGDVLKMIVQDEINSILQLGIPIPEIDVASFSGFVLRTVQNAMVYDFNLDLHNSKLKTLIKEFFIH